MRIAVTISSTVTTAAAIWLLISRHTLGGGGGSRTFGGCFSCPQAGQRPPRVTVWRAPEAPRVGGRSMVGRQRIGARVRRRSSSASKPANGKVLAADIGEVSNGTAAKWLSATML